MKRCTKGPFGVIETLYSVTFFTKQIRQQYRIKRRDTNPRKHSRNLVRVKYLYLLNKQASNTLCFYKPTKEFEGFGVSEALSSLFYLLQHVSVSYIFYKL